MTKKVVLITGTSKGIGKATAIVFAQEGYDVIGTYCHDEKGAEDLKKLGVTILPLDVCDDQSIKDLYGLIKKSHKKIDILINNAGVSVVKPFVKQNTEEIEWQAMTNFLGLMRVTQVMLPLMKTGVIINIASKLALKPAAKMAPYCASKFAVRGFTQSLAQELKEIRVYAVNPCTTATQMTHFKGVDPKKIAKVILKAAQEKLKKRPGDDVNVEDFF